jgi:hypothetical protein
VPTARLDVDVNPLPLPPHGWGVATALVALADAAPALPHLADHPPILVRELSTVVFRCGVFAVKVAPPGTDVNHLSGVLAALRGSRTCLLPMAGPVVTRHGVVTVYDWRTEGPRPSWPAVAALLRRFHAEHADALIPAWRPLRRLPQQLAGLSEDLAGPLLAARDDALEALDSTPSMLGTGAVHGDVSPENALRCPDRLRLIDLDFVGRGPRELDLLGAVRRLRRGELDAGTYRRVCEAYGADVRDWAGLPTLDRVADLSGLGFRIWTTQRFGGDLEWLPGEVGRWERAA